MRALIPPILGPLALLACAHSGRPTDPSLPPPALLACYDVTLGPWTTPSIAGTDSLIREPPSWFCLGPRQAQEDSTAWLVDTSAPLDYASPECPATWWLERNEHRWALQAHWSGCLTGVLLDFPVLAGAFPDTLEGTATVTTDMLCVDCRGPYTPHAPARIIRRH